MEKAFAISSLEKSGKIFLACYMYFHNILFKIDHFTLIKLNIIKLVFDLGMLFGKVSVWKRFGNYLKKCIGTLCRKNTSNLCLQGFKKLKSQIKLTNETKEETCVNSTVVTANEMNRKHQRLAYNMKAISKKTISAVYPEDAEFQTVIFITLTLIN